LSESGQCEERLGSLEKMPGWKRPFSPSFDLIIRTPE
jgi:hypothetical protein